MEQNIKKHKKHRLAKQDKTSHDKSVLTETAVIDEAFVANKERDKLLILPTSFFKPLTAVSLILIILVIVGVVYMISNNSAGKEDNTPKVSQAESGLQIDFEKLEIANEPKEEARGLGYRESICEKCGMLFVFKTESELKFWMKDTKIPLDIIFMDSRGKIVKIHKNTEPMNVQKLYSSQNPAQYVLEVNSGFADKIGLEETKVVDIDHLLKQGVNFVWINIAE